jgi:hypothetical protein
VVDGGQTWAMRLLPFVAAACRTLTLNTATALGLLLASEGRARLGSSTCQRRSHGLVLLAKTRFHSKCGLIRIPLWSLRCLGAG